MTSPPFCPYPQCDNHKNPPTHRWWHRAGSHHTQCFGEIPRFQCSTCLRTFSTQTFSTNYYAKKKIDLRRIEAYLASSMSVRALSRALGCSCGSVLNRVDRLSRQALAAHAALRPRATRCENVCIDGLVSFDRSQYFPNNITIAITSESRYALSFTHATLRRSGTMRPKQKQRRDTLYRGLDFESHALERSFAELLDELKRDRPPCKQRPLVVITDEKKEYARAFAAHPLFRDRDDAHRVVHRTVSSRLPRTFLNPLFPSNYLDREIRKDQAAHRRETTCFGRNVANGVSRMACYLGWHNYSKKYLIKAPIADDQTHGEESGIPRREIERARRRMFKVRAFLSLIHLDAIETKIWMRNFPTPGNDETAYFPKYALS